MLLWLILAGVTLAALVPLLWPLLKPPAAPADRLTHDVEVYRDQLSELEAELEREAISAEEAAEAKREIERRILQAADAADQGGQRKSTTTAVAAVAVALLVPGAAFLTYALLGQPGIVGQLPTRTAGQAAVADPPSRAPDMVELVDKLAARLAENPDDLKGWTLLGRAYWELGRFTEAAGAYGRASELDSEDAMLLVSYGEAMTMASNGLVTPPALAAFKRARSMEPDQAGARFYLALAELQSGRPQYAYNGWLDLARDLNPGSASWRAVVARLRSVAGDLGMDLAADLPAINDVPAATAATGAIPGPTQADVEAAGDMAPEDRQAFIRSMVERLAARLEESPDDFDGWMRLGRAYGVLGELDKSGDAYGRAATLRPDDPTPVELQAMVRLQGVTPGDLPSAPTLAALRQLLALQPDNPRALWYLGLDDARNGRRADAIAKWEKLRDQLPPDSDQRKNLDAGIDELKNNQ